MPRGDREPLKIRRLTDDEQEWAETALAIGMSYGTAVNAFLETFPVFAEEAAEVENLTEDDVFDILKQRFRRIRCDTRRVSYHNVKIKQETLGKFLDCIPVASPILRLVALEEMRQDPGLNQSQQLKVLAAARQEQQALMPRETSGSPFNPNSLPDLPTPRRETPAETAENTEASQSPDPFGGAITKNVNSE